MSHLQWVKWVYERPNGDLEIWARSQSEAAETIQAFLGLKINPDKLKSPGASPQDVHGGDIK